MEILTNKLSTMANERARAVEYFTQNQTFQGYKPQSSSSWSRDDYQDLEEVKTEFDKRKTKSGYEYEVEG